MKFPSFLVRLAAICLLTAAAAAPSPAQGTTSRVTGNVLDASGAAVAGATVTLTNEGTRVTLTTETSESGAYTFDSVQVGTYTVSVERQGFKRFVSTGNSVNVNQPATVDVRLEPGGVEEVVTVDSVAELVQTSTSGNIGNTVEQQTLVSLPIVGNRGRNPLEFINFQPGVVTGANTGGGVHVHGSRDRAFNFTLDGIDINDTTAGGSNFTPIRTNPDMLTEFQVVTSNFTAELGRSSGAQVTLVTRSGTNDFHGTAFEFYQTPRFHANEYVNTINRVGRPQFVQHIFGGSIGGPVYFPRFGEGGDAVYGGKDKTFFFTNLQLLRTSQAFFVNRTVYTQQARNGLFRYVRGGVNRNASQTSPSVDAAGNPLPGLTIGTYNVLANPQGLSLDPEVQRILSFTPLPNNFNIGDGLNTAGFAFVAPQTERQYDFTARVDHNFNDRHALYVRWAQGAQNTLGDNVNGGLQRFPGLPNYVDTFRTPRNLAVNHRWSLSPTVVNEAVFGFNRFTFSFNNPDPQENPPYILNLPTDPLNLEEPVNNARTAQTLQFIDNLSWARGSHTYKFGTNLRFQKHIDDRSSVAGVLTRERVFFSTGINPVPANYNTNVTGINSADRSRLESMINDLLGRVGTINQGFVAISDTQFGPPRTRFNYDARYPEFDFYAQDTWKLRPNFTLDYGLRWEVRLSPRAPNNVVLRPEQRLAAGEPPTNSFTFGEGKLYDDSYRQFAPTVGFAWDPFGSGKTSVRANYRLAYDRTNTFVFSSFIFQSAPGATRAVTNNTFGQNGGLLRNGLPVLNSNDVTPLQFRTPPAFSTNSLTVVDPDLVYPRTHQYSVSFQRELGWKTVLEVNYIGRQGRNLFGGYDANQVDITSNGFLAAFNALQAASNNSPLLTDPSFLINRLLAGHTGLQIPTGSTVRETGAQWLRRQTLAGPVQLANGTTTSNLVAGNSVAQAAFLIAQGVQGSFAAQPGVNNLVANGFSPFFFQPYPQFTGAVNVIESNDRSRYNALEIQLSRRFSQGLSFQGSYTLAKSEDTRSFDPAFAVANRAATGQSSANTPFDINNRELNYARSDFDRRHAIQGYAIYELPWGRGRRWGSDWGGVTDFLLGGFQVGTIARIYSGRPFTVFAGSNTLSQVVQTPASCNNCTSDLGDVTLESGRNVYFTAEQRARFFVPAPGEFSNVGRNFFTGPRFFNIDLTLGKRFRFDETRNLEFRMEVQNATNTPSFAVPDANLVLTSGSFGQILGTTQSTARKVQLVGKFNF
jgi:hypothetical protein